MPVVNFRASAILNAFERAHKILVGKAVVLTDGKAGTVENVWLDELHGLRLSIPEACRKVAHLNHQVFTKRLDSYGCGQDRKSRSVLPSQL
jgi:hypothetical protein